MNPDFLSWICQTVRREAHNLCDASRDGPEHPCYCPCHFPEPVGMNWQCAHEKRDIPVLIGHAPPRAMTDRQRAAIRNFHRNHSLRRRTDFYK